MFKVEDLAASGREWRSPAFDLFDRSHPAVTGQHHPEAVKGAGAGEHANVLNAANPNHPTTRNEPTTPQTTSRAPVAAAAVVPSSTHQTTNTNTAASSLRDQSTTTAPSSVYSDTTNVGGAQGTGPGSHGYATQETGKAVPVGNIGGGLPKHPETSGATTGVTGSTGTGGYLGEVTDPNSVKF